MQPSTTGIILIIGHCLIPSYKGQVVVLRNIKSVNITVSYIKRALQMTLKTKLTSPPPKLRQVPWCHIYHTSIKPPYSIDTIISSPWYFLTNHTSFKPWRTRTRPRPSRSASRTKGTLFPQSPGFFFFLDLWLLMDLHDLRPTSTIHPEDTRAKLVKEIMA